MGYYKINNESDINLAGLFSYVLSASSGKKVYSIFKVQIKKDIARHYALCYILDLHLHLNYRAIPKTCQAENLQNIKTC